MGLLQLLFQDQKSLLYRKKSIIVIKAESPIHHHQIGALHTDKIHRRGDRLHPERGPDHPTHQEDTPLLQEEDHGPLKEEGGRDLQLVTHGENTIQVCALQDFRYRRNMRSDCMLHLTWWGWGALTELLVKCP